MMTLTQVLLCTVLFSVTQSFLLGFLWDSDDITASNKKNKSTVCQCFWYKFIIFVQKYYNFTTFSLWVVYRYISV